MGVRGVMALGQPGPASDEREHLIAHLLLGDGAVDERREEGSPQAAAEAADLIVGTPGERLPQRSGARAEPAVDAGLDVLPRILGAEFQCGLERRADEGALAGGPCSRRRLPNSAVDRCAPNGRTEP